MEQKSVMEEKPAKEHWTRHPAFLIVLPLAITNAAAIITAIKYVTVENVPLFIFIWLVGAVASFIAGVAFPIWAISAILFKDARQEGYLKFLFHVYRGMPQIAYQLVLDLRERKKQEGDI